MNEYYHRFEYTNKNKIRFAVGVEIVLVRDGNLKYRAYDTRRDAEDVQEVVSLRDCPLTRDKKPSIRGIERQVRDELSSWIPFGLPPEKIKVIR